MPILTRRAFCGRVAFGAATLATGFNFHAQTDTHGKEKARKLGVALLGLGRYSTNELKPALLQTERCYLAGVITGHPEKGELWGSTCNLPKRNIYSYENLEQIANNPDIDIIYVVTPPALHPEFAIRAAK